MEPYRFVFMADCQLGCYATFSGLDDQQVAAYAELGMTVRRAPKTEGFGWESEQLRRAIQTVNHLQPDFVVMGGDMVDDPKDPHQLEELRRIVARLDPKIPIRWVPGNHDAAFDTVVPTSDSLRQYRNHFGADSYAFQHKGSAFIAVNTVVWDHPEEIPREWTAQLDSLERELKRAVERRAAHIVVFGHHPLFVADPDEPDTYWNIPQERRLEILELLAEHHADLYMCGHWHRNGGGHSGDLEVVVTGPVGYPLGDDPSGFRIVEVDGGCLQHRYVALDGTSVDGKPAEE